MYLKSIEVQGFKSFANKIVFEFHNGITGIVGPNGSGKSNVADAVRWVLGEQKVKQLRGGTMQDVIFSGTENRKPLSYASVAITLDNSDHKLPVEFEEVKVTRKLYRSGESEYLINGSVCRLKDINEMFYDTGIGKEGYSIIGQGQIDKILSGKPEERRELFDEAAGIVKFKRRKALSLRKLEEEQSNLVRVNDILGELEKQFGPLQKQSETAKEYLKKREELKHYDINMFLVEMKRLKGQIRENDEKLKIAQDELTEAGKKHEDMKAQYEKIEQEVDEIDAGIEHAKSQRNETTLLKQQLENQIELLKEQINSVRMNDEHYEKRANDIQAELANRERQKTELEEEKAEIDRHLAAASERQKQAGEELTALQSRIAEMTVEIEKNQNDIRELLNNRASTKAKLQHYETTLEQIKVRRALLYKRLVEAESDVQRQQELAAQYTEELKAVSGKITDSVEQIKNYETEIAGLQKEIGQANENLRNRQNAYHREYSRLESLRNLTERYDGYGNSIRRVMEQKSREPKILGVVADLIKVDKKYETAVEIALGGSIQNIVTDNEQTAKAIGAQAGVDQVIAGVLPDGKEAVIRKLKEYGQVAMVGDGINDAPALTRADIGIAIGAGADVAIDAADVVLMKSRLSDVPAAVRLSRATLRNIHENLFWAFFYNIIGIPLAAGVWIPIFGWTLNPMFGALAMSLSSFCVVSNALRLNLFKVKDSHRDHKIKNEVTLPQWEASKGEKNMTKTMTIKGMMCGHCEARVKKTLEELEHVTEAQVSHEKGTAVVSMETEVADEVLKKAVEDQGYQVENIQ